MRPRRLEPDPTRPSWPAAAGERADTHPFVDDLRGRNQFRKLYRLLADRGHTPARIEKILGANFVRYAREVWG